MKNTLFISLSFLTLSTVAQNYAANPNRFNEADRSYGFVLPIAPVSIKGSYPLAISEKKTVHIVFPSEIKEVDSGTANILTQITPSFNNVLKIKAATSQDMEETNITVLTAAGGLYSFLTAYTADPEILNINIGNNAVSDVEVSKQLGINQFLFAKYNIPKIDISEREVESKMEDMLKERKFIKNTGVSNLHVTCFLTKIFSDNSLMYFVYEIENNTNIQYAIDFVKLYQRDKEEVKRMTVQEEELPVLFSHPNDTKVLPHTRIKYVVATPIKTLAANKVFDLEIYERNGGRHLRFPITPEILTKTKSLR